MITAGFLNNACRDLEVPGHAEGGCPVIRFMLGNVTLLTPVCEEGFITDIDYLKLELEPVVETV